MRICLIVSYDGTNYCGWQNQKNGLAVQQCIETALARLCGEEIRLTGAGRTDAGVHALGQAAHFDTQAHIPSDKYSYALNALLPKDIRIKRSFAVDDAFHAQYSAKHKHYRYCFFHAQHASAILGRYSMHVPDRLDVEAMRRAASLMTGTHDFSAFCAAGAQTKTFTRTVTRAEVTQQGELLVFDVEGNGFLYNMVRIMAGTLLCVGKGKLKAEDVPEIIASKDRRRAGVTAPPQGLFLMSVRYESQKPLDSV